MSASTIPLFRIDSDALAGFCPNLNLFNLVLSALENTFIFVKLPAPSFLNPNTPSVTSISSNRVWFGFTLNVFPLPTKSSSSISSLISEEDLSST